MCPFQSKLFFYFPTKTYVVGAQKCLDEELLVNTYNIRFLWRNMQKYFPGTPLLSGAMQTRVCLSRVTSDTEYLGWWDTYTYEALGGRDMMSNTEKLIRSWFL